MAFLFGQSCELAGLMNTVLPRDRLIVSALAQPCACATSTMPASPACNSSSAPISAAARLRGCRPRQKRSPANRPLRPRLGRCCGRARNVDDRRPFDPCRGLRRFAGSGDSHRGLEQGDGPLGLLRSRRPRIWCASTAAGSRPLPARPRPPSVQGAGPHLPLARRQDPCRRPGDCHRTARCRRLRRGSAVRQSACAAGPCRRRLPGPAAGDRRLPGRAARHSLVPLIARPHRNHHRR